MNANEDESSNAKEANVVEAEVAKGEQDDVLEDYPRPDKERIKKEPRPRLAPRAVVKREVTLPIIQNKKFRSSER